MEKKTSSYKHHNKPLGTTHHSATSPQLFRSKSGTSVVSTGSRSITTTLSESQNLQINYPNSAHKNPKSIKKLTNLNDYSRSRSQRKPEVSRKTRSASTSPSAWALSPGRAQPLTQFIIVPRGKEIETKKDSSSKGFGGVRGVLGYFTRKKASSYVQEEEYHHFRVIHNRLLQWRFVNAQAEFSTTSKSRFVQKSLVNAYVKIHTKRSMIVEKRIQIEKNNAEVKLRRVVLTQHHLLDGWTRLEKKNGEAVVRLGKKLLAISASLPLIEGAQVDVQSFIKAISMANKTMDYTKSIIAEFQMQAEEICYMITEHSVLHEELMESLKQLQKKIALIRSLLAVESSLIVSQMQLAEGSNGSVIV